MFIVNVLLFIVDCYVSHDNPVILSISFVINIVDYNNYNNNNSIYQ